MKRFVIFIGFVIGLSMKPLFEFCVKIINLFLSGYLSSNFRMFDSTIRVGKGTKIKGAEFFVLGKNLYISENCIIEARNLLPNKPVLHIGDDVLIGTNAHISCINSITIGNNLLTGKNITIVDNSHGFTQKNILMEKPISRRMMSKGPIIIGDDVWIGDKVTILPNVKIGRGCVIGANVVVTEDLDDFSILVSASNRRYVKE